MENRFNAIAFGKKADIIFQCVMFAIMIAAILFNEKSLWSFLFILIMEVAPLLSSIVWLMSLIFKRNAMDEDGMLMRILIVIIFGVLICLGFVGSESFITAFVCIIAVGPFIGIAYFVITCKEYAYYSKNDAIK